MTAERRAQAVADPTPFAAFTAGVAVGLLSHRDIRDWTGDQIAEAYRDWLDEWEAEQ